MYSSYILYNDRLTDKHENSPLINSPFAGGISSLSPTALYL